MAELTCPTCGAAIQPGDLICIDCGANLARSLPYHPEASPLQNSPMSPADNRNDAPRDPTAPMQSDTRTHSNPSTPTHPESAPSSNPDISLPVNHMRPSAITGPNADSAAGSAPGVHIKPTGDIPHAGPLAGCPHCGATVSDPDAIVCMECLRPLDQPNHAAHRLVVTLRNDGHDHEISLTDGEELVLGRDPAQSRVADILAPFDNVSRRHATLFLEGGQAFIRDEGSTNGTFINDTRISPGPRVPLTSGDTLRLAADCTLTLHFG